MVTLLILPLGEQERHPFSENFLRIPGFLPPRPSLRFLELPPPISADIVFFGAAIIITRSPRRCPGAEAASIPVVDTHLLVRRGRSIFQQLPLSVACAIFGWPYLLSEGLRRRGFLRSVVWVFLLLQVIEPAVASSIFSRVTYSAQLLPLALWGGDTVEKYA